MKPSKAKVESVDADKIDFMDKLLEQHSLKKTVLRRSILLTFINAERSLTQGDLIERLSSLISTFDRASIYRNLTSLKEAGILHEVEANNYVLCSHECGAHAHLLLYCQECNKHKEVVNHNKIDSFINAIDGFKFYGKKKPIFLKGVCKSCTSLI